MYVDQAGKVTEIHLPLSPDCNFKFFYEVYSFNFRFKCFPAYMFVHHDVFGGSGGQKMVLDLLKVELYTNGCEEQAGKQTWVL